MFSILRYNLALAMNRSLDLRKRRIHYEHETYVHALYTLRCGAADLDMDNLLNILTKEVNAENEVTSVPNTAGESEFSWQWIFTILMMVLVIVAIYLRSKRRRASIPQKRMEGTLFIGSKNQLARFREALNGNW